jgi:uncharacterized protein YodC (DUF2158 family)
MDINVGDVVILISGGLRVTADYVAGQGTIIRCVWFEGEHLYRGEFSPTSLIVQE